MRKEEMPSWCESLTEEREYIKWIKVLQQYKPPAAQPSADSTTSQRCTLPKLRLVVQWDRSLNDLAPISEPDGEYFPTKKQHFYFCSDFDLCSEASAGKHAVFFLFMSEHVQQSSGWFMVSLERPDSMEIQWSRNLWTVFAVSSPSVV